MYLYKIINKLFKSCTYIIHKDSTAIAIDIGDVQPLVQYLQSNTLQLSEILLTHGHFDHIYGIPRLLEMYPDIPIYTNSYGKDILGNCKRNLSKYNETPIEIKTNTIILEDNEAINVLETKAIAHFTPGHNPSCISWELGSWLFTGDSLIPGVKTITNLIESNKELAIYSENYITKLANEKGLIIYPGHDI